jgi:hypothetical protein
MVAIGGKMIAMSWKQFFGNYEQEPLGAMSPKNFVPGKPHSIALIDGLKKGFGMLFFCFTRRS